MLCCAMLPQGLDKKHKPKPKPKAPTSCGDNKEKRDCLDLGAEEGDCAWCEGDFMPASCVSTMAAKWIPEQVGAPAQAVCWLLDCGVVCHKPPSKRHPLNTQEAAF